MQNPLSDSFEFKNPILDFLKETLYEILFRPEKSSSNKVAVFTGWL